MTIKEKIRELIKKLPPRGTGLRLGRAGARRFGHPRTDEERVRRHFLVRKENIK